MLRALETIPFELCASTVSIITLYTGSFDALVYLAVRIPKVLTRSAVVPLEYIESTCNLSSRRL